MTFWRVMAAILAAHIFFAGVRYIEWRECSENGGIYMLEYGELFYRCMQ